MKTRTRFVSNSSSTSFIILTTQRNHDRAVSSLSKEQQKVLKKIEPLQQVRFLDTDLVEITGSFGNKEWLMSGDDRCIDNCWELTSDYKKALGNGGDVYIGGVDS